MIRSLIPGLFFLLSISLISHLDALPVIISGNAPTYAGDDLIFYSISDYISGTQQEMGRCKISSEGEFSVLINTDETIQVFAFLGVFKSLLWVAPHKEYRVVLPEKLEKSMEEILNPFFEPVEVSLGLENFSDDELNILIMMFNDAYNPYYNKHVNDVYKKPESTRTEEDIQHIEKSFHKYPNDFFMNYRYYSYGQLKLLANQQKVRSLSGEYFDNKPILYHHPAYMELFNQVYDKYFIFLARTEAGKKIYDDINLYRSYASLLQTLAADKNISNDTLRELVILKSVYNEFYGMEFSRNGLLGILDSLILSSRIPEHKAIGLQIKHKITRLLAGYDPPDFELFDTDSNLVRLTDFKGKYVYLNFCTSSSYTCINEYKLLNGIYQRHNKRLTIITISTDPYESAFDQFKSKNNYNWVFLYYGHQPDIVKEYDIRAFPTYFLIGPDGKLIFSPAPSPAENFEAELFEAMRSRGDL
jgi:peroxiredoxin